MYYFEYELKRIHRHFYHPGTDKLVNLIHQEAPEHDEPELRKKLEHIRKSCEPCQRLAKQPGLFHVFLQNEDCVFNRTVGMDIMKINKQSVLHEIDRDTEFGAATFLDGESSEKYGRRSYIFGSQPISATPIRSS